MELFKNIPYSLGSKLEDVNLDLELRQTLLDGTLLYSSYKYSEVYLFGQIFESVCYLFIYEGKVIKIDYRFPMEQFHFFRENIDGEFPNGVELSEDPFVEKASFALNHNGTFISIRQINENFFMLRIADSNDLPRIKTTN